jgi:hypothetical protein
MDMARLILLGATLTIARADVAAVAAEVLYDYAAREADELSLVHGDTISIVGAATSEGPEWVRGRLTLDGWTGLLPLSYVRLLPPSPAIGTSAATAAGAAFSAAIAAAQAAAEEDDGNTDNPALREAMRRYRRRRAAYNGNAELLEKRWGVRLDLERTSDGTEALAAQLGQRAAEPTEHRSGVGGVPFFNLVEHMDAAVLSRELCALLRHEWLPPHVAASPSLLAGLDRSLSAAAAASTSSRDVILTFANLGYTDFVLNGFGAQRANTLVVALDEGASPDPLRCPQTGQHVSRSPCILSSRDAHLIVHCIPCVRATSHPRWDPTCGTQPVGTHLRDSTCGTQPVGPNLWDPTCGSHTPPTAGAHALLTNRSYHSYFDALMPTMQPASATHTSAAFMDIMKLRLLYLAEVRSPCCTAPHRTIPSAHPLSSNIASDCITSHRITHHRIAPHPVSSHRITSHLIAPISSPGADAWLPCPPHRRRRRLRPHASLRRLPARRPARRRVRQHSRPC